MMKNGEAAGVVRARVSVACLLNLQVIAEVIETRDQALQLAALDIDYGQGFYFARPASAERCTALLEQPLRIDQDRHRAVVD